MAFVFEMIIKLMLLALLMVCRCIHASIPHIDVQSTFIEAWETTPTEDFQPMTGHMIVINTGMKIESGMVTPLNSSDVLEIQIPSQDLPIWISNSKAFELKWLEQGRIYTMPLNDAGRFSFTIPLELEGNYYVRLPPLLVRTHIFPEHQWYC